MERRFWFNESNLKDLLGFHNLPQSYNNIRILKEHAASSGENVIDFRPAINLVKKLNSKVSFIKITECRKLNISELKNKVGNIFRNDSSNQEQKISVEKSAERKDVSPYSNMKLRFSFQRSLPSNRTIIKNSQDKSTSLERKSLINNSGSKEELGNLVLLKQTFLKPSHNLQKFIDSRNNIQDPSFRLQSISQHIEKAIKSNRNKSRYQQHLKNQDKYGENLEEVSKSPNQNFKSINLKLSSRKSFEVANFNKIVKKNTKFWNEQLIDSIINLWDYD